MVTNKKVLKIMATVAASVAAYAVIAYVIVPALKKIGAGVDLDEK